MFGHDRRGGGHGSPGDADPARDGCGHPPPELVADALRVYQQQLSTGGVMFKTDAELDQAKTVYGLVTEHILSPIPDRSMDWCAHVDGEEERGECGWGPTEAAAVADWI